jgi:hypothetical protein
MSTMARYGVAGTGFGPLAAKIPTRDPNVGSERHATG